MKTALSFSFLLLINLLFAIKYAERITGWYPAVAVAVVALQAGFYYGRHRMASILEHLKIGPALYPVGFMVAAAGLFTLIGKETLAVDRWSVIESFWDMHFAGGYAYDARSFDNNPPGPMPFYFILNLPFHLMGETGWFALVGVVLLFFMLRGRGLRHMVFLQLALGAWLWWEIASRSNVFTNGVLVLGAMVFFFRYYNKTAVQSLLFGCLFGLVLSTRSVFLIPLLCMGIFAWKNGRLDFCQVLLMAFSALLVFAATFLPFVSGHWDRFGEANPFIVQSTFLLPFGYTVFFVLMAAVAGWLCKNEDDVFFSSGLLLFATILCYLSYTVWRVGFSEAFFGSAADISYFILCIPFALWYVSLREPADKRTGRRA